MDNSLIFCCKDPIQNSASQSAKTWILLSPKKGIQLVNSRQFFIFTKKTSIMAKRINLEAYELFYPPGRTAWRQWLMDNHAKSPGVWLVFFKKDSGKSSVGYDEAVEEALCFGWIDSLPNKIDEYSYKQLFSPRKPKSNWSKLNKERVEKLIAAGLMQAAGLEKIELAKQNGTWDALNDVEQLLVPADMQQALDANPIAQENWEKFSRSVRRSILEWILNAKREETRAKRIEETVRLAAQNIKANQYERK